MFAGLTRGAIERTFESALACIGFPSPLAAFWLGHSAAVAHRHCLAFAPGRLPGRTVEAVLGLDPYIGLRDAEAIEEILIVAVASEPEERKDRVDHLPL